MPPLLAEEPPVIRSAAVLVALLACAALSGCCTMCSICDDREDGNGKLPYGGTTRCVGAMQSTLFDDFFIAIPNSRALCFAVQVCDLPLSAAADTLLLPYTVPYWLIHGVGQPAASEQGGQAPTGPQAASEQYQFGDQHFVIDVPPGGHLPPERVHGGIGPGY